MKRRLDWFAFDPTEFSQKVRFMSFAETGAFIRLLCEAWFDSRCSLPSDDNMLIRLLHTTPREWKAVREAVLAQFESSDGRLHNKWLSEIRDEAQKRVDAARALADKRWDAARAKVERTPSPLDPSSQREEENKREQSKREETTTTTVHASAKADANADANASTQVGSSRGGDTSFSSSLSLTSKRKWLHDIWLAVNPEHPLKTLPKHEDNLEVLITSHTEVNTSLGWMLYVCEDPPSYNLEPIERAVECTGKQGNKWLETATDGGSVTRFPLASFLSSPQGYIEAAKLHLENGTAPYLPSELKVLWKELAARIKS